jgi:hypothetical protein
MVYFFIFKPKIAIWEILEGLAMLIYFMDIWSNLRPFDIFYGPLVYFVVIWYIFSSRWHIAPKNLATLGRRKNSRRNCDAK